MTPELLRDLRGRYGAGYNDGLTVFPDGGFKVAGHWDHTERWDFSARGILAAYAAFVESAPGPSVLDVGCGRGTMVEALRQRGADAFGVDIGEDVRCQHGAVASALRLPFSEPFDLVVALDLIEHLPDDDQAELHAELRRVTSGPLFVTVPTEEPHYRYASHVGARNHYLSMSVVEWRALFRSNSWQVITDGATLAHFGAPFAWGPGNHPFLLHRRTSCS